MYKYIFSTKRSDKIILLGTTRPMGNSTEKRTIFRKYDSTYPSVGTQ